MVEVADIICHKCLFPSKITSDLPPSSLKDPLLTEIAVPSVMALIVCFSAYPFGRNDGSHVCCSNCGCLSVLVILVPEHFIVKLFTLSVFVFIESVGGDGIEFSPVFMKHQWLALHCLSKSGR